MKNGRKVKAPIVHPKPIQSGPVPGKGDRPHSGGPKTPMVGVTG